jgi:hypothetical protein
MPDFRPRIWWCPAIRGGLLFACRHGAVAFADPPIAYVRRGHAESDDVVVPVSQLDAQTVNLLPKLRQQALQEWFAPGHASWAVYWRDAADPLAQQMEPPPAGAGGAAALPLPLAALGMPTGESALFSGTGLASAHQLQQPFVSGRLSNGGGSPTRAAGSPVASAGAAAAMSQHMFGGLVPPGAVPLPAGFAFANMFDAGQQQYLMQHQYHPAAAAQPPQQHCPPASSLAAKKGASPFAAAGTQGSVPVDAFPDWASAAAAGANGSAPGSPAPVGAVDQRQRRAVDGAGDDADDDARRMGLDVDGRGLSVMLPSLEMLNTDDIATLAAHGSAPPPPSFYSLDSVQQLQLLGELPSVGVGHLLGAGGPATTKGGGAGAGALGGAGAAGGGDEFGVGMERGLSLKLSMSLDLVEMAA